MNGKCSASYKEDRAGDDTPSKDEFDTTMMFDTITFIAEVEKRPAIYDHSKIEYADRIARTRAWNEVCEIIVPNWSTLSKENKHIEAKALKSKWRNVRDYFMKEFKYESSRAADKSSKKRKRCVYYDHLLFLVPNAKTREEQRIEHGMSITENAEDEEYAGDTNTAGTFEFVTTSDYQNSIGEASMASSNDDYINVLKIKSEHNSQRDDEDYDRMFLLSLLPMMRQLPEDKKLDVRIQMQQSIALALREERTEK